MTDVLAALALGISLVALATALTKSSSSSYAPGSVWYEPPKTDTQVLAELEAREKLEKKYKWTVPKYNLFMGEKVLDKDVTEEMKQSLLFIERHSLGKWVKR